MPIVLDRELHHLVDAELLYQKGTALRTAVFEFKHALIRDAAYNLLTKAERESYHRKAGQLLEERFSERAKPNLRSSHYHYTQARSYEKAVHYWYEAGKQSAGRSAHNEAVGHLNQGLKLLSNIADPKLAPSRDCCCRHRSATRSGRSRAGAMRVRSRPTRVRFSRARKGVSTSIPCLRCSGCFRGISFSSLLGEAHALCRTPAEHRGEHERPGLQGHRAPSFGICAFCSGEFFRRSSVSGMQHEPV